MGQKAILGLLPHVDRDIEEGKYDLQTATAVKLYINRCAQVCANMAVQSSTQRAMSQGQIQMGEANVKVVKKFHEDELRRAEAIAAAEAESRAAGKSVGEEESVDLRSRPSGVHPPASIKQQRLAEEAAEAKAEAARVEAEVKAAEAAAEAALQESARAELAKAAEVARAAEIARLEAEKAAQEDKPSWTLEQIGLLVKAEPAPVFRKKPGPKPKTSLSPALSPALVPSRKKPGPKPKPKT